MDRPLRLGIVGPCSAGKTTLAGGLSRLGYDARAIAQEHSFAPRMWRQITDPDVLVFLDVTFDVAQARRQLNWTPADLAEQHRRLAHARAHCDFYLDTDPLTIEQVQVRVLEVLQAAGRA